MRALLLLLVAPLAVSAADPPRGKQNRLAGEVSPYLRQHAHNPVDWYPWGPEAFARAKKEGKLVFLSIGYSSCHWCHVMERESFASPAVADVLNKHFVCIKVDREERPDVDEVYMTAMQVAGDGGGWPLSMFLTPDGKPIFGGTYWPPEDREVDGETIPGFKSVLKKVIDLDKEKRKELLAQADTVAERTAESLERNNRLIPIIKLDRELVSDAAAALELDPIHGGFGSRAREFKGAKFPRASALALLLRVSSRPEYEKVAKQVTLTLEQMASGGLYDHLGGGFHRYSTERTWTVPHFEKMLYDNAQLVELYADAYRADPKPAYRRVIADTLGFVARELTSPEGAFYSALDADSEGEEGKFYVWTAKEIDDVLGSGENVRRFKTVYSADQPNFEEKYQILRLSTPVADEATLARLKPLREKLLAVRSKRERPFLDTKVLTGWNGQMIAAYARVGEVLKETGYVSAAEKAANFLLTTMRAKDGRLMRVFAAKPGGKPESRGPAFLEDYAFLVHGFLNLHDATGQAKWLDEAKALTSLMLKWHGDADRGGFYMTAHDGEKLFARGKDHYDGALPSGNGMAARNLVRLFAKTKDEQYKNAAEKTVKQFAAVLRTQPQAAPLTAEALDHYLELTAKAGPQPGPR
ncbi:MAG TPA: thioredoxin domain-containing protein [Fimbriiglobus sp.]|nr:thioredoxin domain-containing protein [Fimbriiglobus sp.]